jgi:hypothetical protein
MTASGVVGRIIHTSNFFFHSSANCRFAERRGRQCCSPRGVRGFSRVMAAAIWSSTTIDDDNELKQGAYFSHVGRGPNLPEGISGWGHPFRWITPGLIQGSTGSAQRGPRTSRGGVMYPRAPGTRRYCGSGWSGHLIPRDDRLDEAIKTHPNCRKTRTFTGRRGCHPRHPRFEVQGLRLL